MFTTYFKSAYQRKFWGQYPTPVVPSSYYVALSKTTPTVSGTGVTEPTSAAGYARKQIENNTNNFIENGTGLATNTDAITFNASTADWGVITHFAVYDALTGGNLLFFDSLEPGARTVESGVTLQIPANSFRIQLENEGV